MPETKGKELEAAGIVPDKVLYLEVPDDMLIERVVGRRLDPETGKIYHVKYFPPESDEVAARLTQRADDTEEKARVRLEQIHSNMKAVESCYAGNLVKFDAHQFVNDSYHGLLRVLRDFILPRPRARREFHSWPHHCVTLRLSLGTPRLSRLSRTRR